MDKAKRKKKNKRTSVRGNWKKTAIRLAVFVVFTLFVVEVILLENNIARVKENVGYQQLVLDDVRMKRDALMHTAESVNDEEFILSQARGRLGMIKPGEKIVVDTSDKDSLGMRKEFMSEESQLEMERIREEVESKQP